ncbi:Retrotransposable element SLACS protein [Amphibalanus amphitrite]|uniref:Retrotransposable element SLACS protein n=2 Tax=Amphibalanus amphitrite TaxID=1232801 RepID=A0A6A4WT18_AMPAM|nr:Retrotransposable element SLACS protein [Amphibalanus amphitrite]
MTSTPLIHVQSSVETNRVKNPVHGKRQRPEHNEDGRLQRSVAAKIEDGDVRGAIRLLASKDQLAQSSQEIIDSLQLKHPPSPDDLALPAAPDESIQLCQVTEPEVAASIASFDTGSSAGLDGLRPAHLKDLTTRSTGEAGVRLISALTALVNLVLSGDVPASARDAFFGGALTALRKPGGGVRPIAVGNTYRRLATKVALKPISAELGDLLRPVQLGYGTTGGCEAAAHATRRFNDELGEGSAIIKIDMRNAFNSIRRDHFLHQVRERVPSLFHLLWQAYSAPTPLFYETATITSATGLQQGDPCGPAVFALAIDQVARGVTAPFNCWYLDDGTIGGQVSTICLDLQKLIPAMASIGLSINARKCEIILPDGSADEEAMQAVRRIHELIPGAAVLGASEQTILGAPITEAAADTVMEEKQGELKHMVERLHHLDAHTALFLLRNCIWLPKLQYLLRASPLYRQASLLSQLDAVMQSALTSISNVKLTGASWEQAVLPTRYGGLGLRLLVDVALPSYVSSLHACHGIIYSCLPDSMTACVTEEREKAVNDWQEAAGGENVPERDEQLKQKAWDAVLAKQQQEKLLSEANQYDRARLLSTAAPESGAWLHAAPSANLGTLLDRETLRVAIALRLGADVCRPHRCRCGSIADSKGYHALTCKFSAGRHPRHTALNDIVRRALQSARIPSLLEPTGVDRGDGKRPDGISIFPFKNGMCLAWDATCVNTYADSHVLAAATSAGTAAREAEVKKRKKYDDLTQRFHFEPLAFETSGACGPSTKVFVRELGARIASVTEDRRETAWLWQRLALAVVRGNAASILQTAEHEVQQKRREQETGTWRGRTVQNRRNGLREEPLGVGELHCALPSRNPLDDPELAQYLKPRAAPRSVDERVATTQELTDQLLSIAPSCSEVSPGSPRPNRLATYASLLAEMKRDAVSGYVEPGG